MSTSKRVERRAGVAGKWKSRFSLSPSLSALPSPVALEVSEIEIILPYQLANLGLNQNLRGSYRWWHEQSRRRTKWELASETSSNRWLPFTGLLHTMTQLSRLSFCRNAWGLAILCCASDFWHLHVEGGRWATQYSPPPPAPPPSKWHAAGLIIIIPYRSEWINGK